MDRLKSIKDDIVDLLQDSEDSELESCKTWLEGWICGITDPVLTTNGNLKDDAMSFLLSEYETFKSK